MNANLSNEQINGLKAGIQDVMQGLMTLNKVLTMIQVPESAKYPDGRPQLHDSHVEAYKRHHGIHDSHVECRDRFKAELHDGHVQLWKEQKRSSSPILQAVLRGAETALAKNPDSPYLKKCVEDQKRLMAGPQEGDLPEDSASLWTGRPMR